MRSARNLPILAVGMFLVAPISWGAAASRNFSVVTPTTKNEVSRTFANTDTTLCHRPSVHPENVQTIVVGRSAVPAHLAHGDTMGACIQECAPQQCDACPVCEICDVCDPGPGTCPEPQPSVQETGQTGCWDQAGASIGCAGTGQDGEYQYGANATPRVTDNSDGTVKDNVTNLIWLKDSDCFGGKTWSAALAASNALASGTCGLTDGSTAGAWRLPNAKELQSLLDFGHVDPALPAGAPFIGMPSQLYWSSTSHAVDGVFAWYVSVMDGAVSNAWKGNAMHVWPVRGGE